MKKPESQLFFNWINSKKLRTELTRLFNKSKIYRRITQTQLAETLQTPLTKIKQVENGTCVDFNAIYNYIAFYGNELV